MGKTDSILSNFGYMLLGAFYFGTIYGIKSDTAGIFFWGLGMLGCATPIAIYFFIKNKMWKHR